MTIACASPGNGFAKDALTLADLYGKRRHPARVSVQPRHAALPEVRFQAGTIRRRFLRQVPSARLDRVRPRFLHEAASLTNPRRGHAVRRCRAARGTREISPARNPSALVMVLLSRVRSEANQSGCTASSHCPGSQSCCCIVFNQPGEALSKGTKHLPSNCSHCSHPPTGATALADRFLRSVSACVVCCLNWSDGAMRWVPWFCCCCCSIADTFCYYTFVDDKSAKMLFLRKKSFVFSQETVEIKPRLKFKHSIEYESCRCHQQWLEMIVRARATWLDFKNSLFRRTAKTDRLIKGRGVLFNSFYSNVNAGVW